MSRRQQLVAAWNGFWFAQGSPIALAVFRVLFALCLLFEVRIGFERNTAALAGGFHLPYLDWIPTVSPEWYAALHTLQYPMIVLLGIGLLTRASCLGLIAIQGYFLFADQMLFRNHPYFFLLVLVLLAVSPCAEALSFDRVLRRFRRDEAAPQPPAGSDQPLTAQRLIQVQVSLVYVFAAIQKINVDYLDGLVLSTLYETNLLEGTSFRVLSFFFDAETLTAMRAYCGDPRNWVAFAWVSIAVEIFIGFGLWFHRPRAAALLLGVGLHVQIMLFLDIHTFSVATMASYLLFLDPARWQHWRSTLVKLRRH